MPHSKYKLSGPNVVLDKCCMNKCHCDSVHLFQIVLYVYIQSMVNIWSLYAKIRDIQNIGGGWVDGWMGGWFLTGNNTTSWLHLASWNLQDFQLSWKSNMKPSVAIYEIKYSKGCIELNTDDCLSSWIFKLSIRINIKSVLQMFESHSSYFIELADIDCNKTQ